MAKNRKRLVICGFNCQIKACRSKMPIYYFPMQELNLPNYEFRITKADDGKLFIFDEYRKKNLRLSPEEWVRQNILRYLIEDKGYPKSLVSSEAGIKVNTLSRRYDALIYNNKGEALLLIECKAPSIKISQDTFDQVVAYNLTVKAEYILVTNGLKHYCCGIDAQTKQVSFLQAIPAYNEVNT